MNCVILGSNSGIAKSLVPHLEEDGWTIQGWNRSIPYPPKVDTWNLCISALGRVSPVGHWSMIAQHDFVECIGGASDVEGLDGALRSNLLMPIQLLGSIWAKRAINASVCFLAGPNPNKPLKAHFAYYVAKMALLKAVEAMDEESDAKVFSLGTGYVDTKIHEPTLDAGIELKDRVSTPIERIYRCLKWANSQPKQVIGGRNIHINDPWDDESAFLASRLAIHSNLFKLRRAE